MDRRLGFLLAFPLARKFNDGQRWRKGGGGGWGGREVLKNEWK